MKHHNQYRPFAPCPEQQRLVPDESGNAINGLGEEHPRRPHMVYWAPDPDTIPHGRMQRWFYGVNADHPALIRARAGREVILNKPIHDVAPEVISRSPDDWTAALDQFVQDGSCEMTGVAELRPEWVFDHHEVTQSRVIVLGVQHDYDEISKAPNPEAGGEVMRQYGRAGAAAKEIANWLRDQGWEAEPLAGSLTGKLTLIPPALECGFGELGKHGSIINPEFGASFRLAAVLTDAPFAPTPRRDFGIDGFCAACRICEDACPPLAIGPDKQTVRGTEKWYVDFDRCLPFFNETNGCGICIAECPWSRPGVGMNLAAKLARRAARD